MAAAADVFISQGPDAIRIESFARSVEELISEADGDLSRAATTHEALHVDLTHLASDFKEVCLIFVLLLRSAADTPRLIFTPETRRARKDQGRVAERKTPVRAREEPPRRRDCREGDHV
jgi:hypothetical protein